MTVHEDDIDMESLAAEPPINMSIGESEDDPDMEIVTLNYVGGYYNEYVENIREEFLAPDSDCILG